MSNSWSWRIAANAAALEYGSFHQLSVPAPSLCTYKEYSNVVARSNGADASHGFENVSILWDILTAKQAQAINDIVETARIKNGTIFLTVDKAIGLALGFNWVDIEGYPLQMNLTSALRYDRSIKNDGPYYRNVSLKINAITVVNDPSLYSTC